MRLPFEIIEKTDCSLEEKLKLLPLVDLAVHLIDQSRNQGLLSIEENLSSIKNPFFAFGVKLLVDGTSIENIQECFVNLIAASHKQGSALLEIVLSYYGILYLCDGDSSDLARTKLYCLLGEEVLKNKGLMIS